MIKILIKTMYFGILKKNGKRRGWSRDVTVSDTGELSSLWMRRWYPGFPPRAIWGVGAERKPGSPSDLERRL